MTNTTTKPETATKPEKKAATDSQKLDMLIKAARANGWSLPKELDEEE